MHRGHRVPSLLPRPQLGGQLAEPGRQHRRVLGGRTARPPRPPPGDGARTPAPPRSSPRRPARTAPPSAAPDHRPRPAGRPVRRAGPPGRPATAAAAPAAAPGPRPARTTADSLGQLGLDPGAQPLDQALHIAELRRADLAGNLSPERDHQRRLSRDPLYRTALTSGMLVRSSATRGIPRLAGPAELQMGDRQALWVAIGGLESIPVPQDQHIQVTCVDVIKAAVPHRFTVGPVTVDGLMPRRHQPAHDGPAFPLQVGDRGRHINLGHHPPHPGPPSPVTQPSHSAARLTTQTRPVNMGRLVYSGHPHKSRPQACPAVGAEWEQRSAASCGQTRSVTVIVATSIASDVQKRRQAAGLSA